MDKHKHKHTPKPWMALPSTPPDGVECYWLVGDAGRLDIGSINGPQSGVQEANARLAAAAPALLEALENLLIEFESFGTLETNETAIKEARAAIRAATEPQP